MSDPVTRLNAALEGRYRIESELGEGGMATVYLADDLKHERQVALKVLKPELAAVVGAERFLAEIKTTANLQHPHILPLFDSGEADTYLFYVMPYVEGESLRDRLDRERRIPLDEAVRIAINVAEALDYAHRQGVIHRDIKPANILLAQGLAMVADFGLARARAEVDAERLTQSGMALGTPAYMSPEQGFDPERVDGRADVYALGCVLFEMLAGRPPFDARTAVALLARHAAERAPSLRTIDKALPLFVDRAVSQALAKEPAQRFQSPGDFADTLRDSAVVSPVGRRRVAVLPPANLTNDADQDFLVLGLHEALISELGGDDVAVLARTSVQQYVGTDKRASEISAELAVDGVVESSLIRAGDALAIQARLIDGATEESMWSRSLDGSIGEVLSLFRELARGLATEVQGTLGAASERKDAPESIDPVAYENYMRGRVSQQNFMPSDLDRAIEYYEAALALEPGFAPAYAGMALIWGSRAVLGLIPTADAGPEWKAAAERAIELDPDLAEGHQALAQAYTWYEFDWERAEAAYQRAITLNPNEPQARIFYSHLLAMLRRPEDSDEQIAQALVIDPHNPFTQMLRGIQLGLTGRHEEAIEGLGMVSPNPLAVWALAWQYFRLGRMAEGVEHYAEYFDLLGDVELVSIMRGQGSDPEAALIRGAEVLAARAETQFVKPNNMWHMFGWGGDIDRAVEWLERGYAMGDHEIAYQATEISPDALRSDPRFKNVLDRLGLPLPMPAGAGEVITG